MMGQTSSLGDKFDEMNLMIVSSFPPPAFPPASRFGQVAGDAISVAIVSFAVSISMAKLFAKKHSYQLDSDQVHFCMLPHICLRLFM